MGVARLLGYNLRDAAHFCILATNPSDMWKRWSTYMYEWMLAVVFIPFWTKIRSVLLAHIACFIVLYFVHLPSLLYSTSTSPFQWDWLKLNLIYFLLHALFVYFGYLTRRLWPSGARLNGWWGILVIQLVLVLIHSVLSP